MPTLTRAEADALWAVRAAEQSQERRTRGVVVAPARRLTRPAEKAAALDEQGPASFALADDGPVTLEVVGIPRPQPRPRRSKCGGVYTPDDAEAWKLAVRQAWMARYADRPPMLGPLVVVIVCRLPRPPTSMRPWPDSREGDFDNLAKSTCDALTRLTKKSGSRKLAWHDDGQIVDGRCVKRWTRPGEQPGATITIGRATALGKEENP